mmetsp:Transcript_2131/g.4564  ORF Transcript_2131/g.4564 Transcript_2131/m.4564 type:complete len:807 (-) Transcript_2131:65-2485(-)
MTDVVVIANGISYVTKDGHSRFDDLYFHSGNGNEERHLIQESSAIHTIYKEDKRKKDYKTSSKLMLASLVILSVIFICHNIFNAEHGNLSEPGENLLGYDESMVKRRRLLQEEKDTKEIQEESLHVKNDTKVDGEQEDDELPDCSDILLHDTPEDRCHHAQNCDGEYIMTSLLPWAFCTEYSFPKTTIPSDQDNKTLINAKNPIQLSPMMHRLFPILFPLALILVTILLFRLLATTAENFFSPALEMLSSEFRIPPSLAGITLLALGNGAPDLSACINAIKANPSEGISLSLGELTGGGMFVQTVVIGRVVSWGSKMMTSCGQVGENSISEMGVSCRGDLIRDISMYGVSAAYIFWVCSKGVVYYYHVLAMFLLYGCYVMLVFVYEARRYYANNNFEADYSEERDSEEGLNDNKNIDEDENEDEDATLLRKASDSKNNDEVLVKRPTGGRRQSVDPPAPHDRDLKHSRNRYSSRIIRVVRMQQQRQKQFQKTRAVRDKGKYSDGSVIKSTTAPQDIASQSLEIQFSVRDLLRDLHGELYTESLYGEDATGIEFYLLLFEYPFIIIRKLVTPIPCEAEYNRSMVSLSIALSPLWLIFYASTKKEDADIVEGYPIRLTLLVCCLSFAMGVAFFKSAPKDDSSLIPLRFKLPIALYGFFIAATWIDVISDQLVNVLEFIGTVCLIPSSIMGMTVLAWGNSVGDFSTNSALAQKGLADMSVAACFAGPSFNLLIGLGSGLLTQKESLLADGVPISLMPSVQLGFIFLIFNCTLTIASGLWHGGYIPRWNAYVFFAMYFGYMAMSSQHLLL